MDLQERYQRQRVGLDAAGQGHLLRFWDELDIGPRRMLLDDLDQVGLDRCVPLIESMVLARPQAVAPKHLEPVDVFPIQPDRTRADLYTRARESGQAAIRQGRVAAFTVAGGQGTRLGYDGPKGGLPVTPVRNACLFQLFAEQLRGVARRYGHLPRWYIMTSPLNHIATLEIFERREYFGLPAEEVVFFPQCQMPAFMPDGRIAMVSKFRVALGPDGHGGSLAALAGNGALADMRARGIDYLSYFQVDNPLVHAIDPLFIGLHIETGSEMSSKAVTKAHDLERVGNYCRADGRVSVIEYSDMPEALARETNDDGSRRYDAGSVAIHVLSRDLVERLTRANSGVELPWHRADKALSVIDPDSAGAGAELRAVVKLELFVFDAIPLAEHAMVLYTAREEEFSPVKNAEGDDSPATSRRDQLRRAVRWLETVGVAAVGDGHEPPPWEISPAFALDVEDLRSRKSELVGIRRDRQCVLE
jgi:UDP-N-acetylglucosamine/UDP-N-acetylgalactosamine diphosphorylase